MSKWLTLLSLGALRAKIESFWPKKLGQNFSSTSDTTIKVKMTQFFSLRALRGKKRVILEIYCAKNCVAWISIAERYLRTDK